ncbi:hypothetical protein FPQ18DRAFT_396214 [Pyronema domesticum]|uniref:Uncharacterized protein n=1 Tax=Pyronema omphalodes (strain CBS 100304) TaxID=1076935 RepID=U4LRU9_PYROM|nr:hypothetical protein FPQ18DRAFT_396214 [Pyronema domesticum]CCX30021.1 Protein of unknown function [Pyronema omphalodes CBS 100304]
MDIRSLLNPQNPAAQDRPIDPEPDRENSSPLRSVITILKSETPPLLSVRDIVLTPEEPNEAVNEAVEAGEDGEPGEPIQEPEDAAHPAVNDDFNLRTAYGCDGVLHYVAPGEYMFQLQSYTGLILVPIERNHGGDIEMVDAGDVNNGREMNNGREVNNGQGVNNGGEVNNGETRRSATPPLSPGVFTRSMTRRPQRQAEQQAQQQQQQQPEQQVQHQKPGQQQQPGQESLHWRQRPRPRKGRQL